MNLVISDLDNAKDPVSGRSITEAVMYLDLTPVIYMSAMRKTVALSVTEAELSAAVMVIQEMMMFVSHMITSLGLNVRLPIKLKQKMEQLILQTVRMPLDTNDMLTLELMTLKE